MKKTVKPAPLKVGILGAGAAILLILTIVEVFREFDSVFILGLMDLLAVGIFVYELLKYLAQEKIEFDESSFTVGEKTYGYNEITNVTVNNEQVLRSVSTLRIKLYIGEDEVASFTKDDSGGKDFIAVMKKHGITVSVDV